MKSDPKDVQHHNEGEGEDDDEKGAAGAKLPQQQQLTAQTPGPAQETEIHITTTDKTALDISSLTPGKLVKVKGTLSVFRSTTQLQLERFFPIADTNTEMQFLDQRIRFLVEVLTLPWVLTEEETKQLKVEAEEEEERIEQEQERARKRQRKRVEREERHQRQIQKMWGREERAREKEAISCQDAGRRVMRELEKRKRVRRDV